MTHDHDSVEDALKDAIGGTDNSMLRRVLRESRGQAARPAAIDYVAAMQATDGAVCVELDVETHDRVIFRYLPDADEYERYGDFQTSGEDVGPVSRSAVSRWIGSHGAEICLQDDDLAELFEQGQRAATDGGTTYDGP